MAATFKVWLQILIRVVRNCRHDKKKEQVSTFIIKLEIYSDALIPIMVSSTALIQCSFIHNSDQ